jgi:hypothetical protein
MTHPSDLVELLDASIMISSVDAVVTIAFNSNEEADAFYAALTALSQLTGE